MYKQNEKYANLSSEDNDFAKKESLGIVLIIALGIVSALLFIK